MSWYWNWANTDHGSPGGDYADPTTATFQNDPSTIKEKAAINAWFQSMQPQSFYDAYGLPVNVAKAQSANPADKAAAIPNWTPYDYVNIQAAGAGKIHGLYPVGTIDNQSKGVELEFTARPLKNWNVTFNASKTTAERTGVGATLANFIITQHDRYAGPAGDLRIWWSGNAASNTFRAQFAPLWAAYQFQLESNGRDVPELRPWRFNLVTGYVFDHGFLKGTNVGGGYRWQDAQILGYGLKNINTTTGDAQLDVNKPIHGKSEYGTDLWVGYTRKLTSKINWRIQLNLRDVGRKVRLVPISVEPDGAIAASRIVEGQTWEVTNTLMF